METARLRARPQRRARWIAGRPTLRFQRRSARAVGWSAGRADRL